MFGMGAMGGGSEFDQGLAGLYEFLAQRELEGESEPDPRVATPQPYGAMADPVYGGLFSLPQQMEQMQGMVPGGMAGRDLPNPGGDLMTRRGVTMVAPALRSLLQAKRQLDLPILRNVVSDYRTRAEQQRLYDAYLNGTGNLAAPPGSSMHEQGRAVDIATSFLNDNPELKRWLLQHGWSNDVGGEPWHWSWG